MDKKMPAEELKGNKPLSGTYKVSFVVHVSPEDELTHGDLVQRFASGFEGKILDKIAEMDVEKISKDASLKLKVGDSVYLVADVKLTAKVYVEDGFYVVGKKTEFSQEIGDAEITLKRGSSAFINKLTKEGSAELIDVDCQVEIPLNDPETDEPFNAFVAVEQVSVSADLISKVVEE